MALVELKGKKVHAVRLERCQLLYFDEENSTQRENIGNSSESLPESEYEFFSNMLTANEKTVIYNL